MQQTCCSKRAAIDRHHFTLSYPTPFNDNGEIVSNTYQSISISCDAALRLVERAVVRAREEGVAVCIAVIDPRGALKAFAGMDNAPQIAQDMSRTKAMTALMGLGSGELGAVLDGQWPQLASLAATPGITMMGGGLPLFENDRLIGAIGVGGASTEQDIAIAEAAREALAI